MLRRKTSSYHKNFDDRKLVPSKRQRNNPTRGRLIVVSLVVLALVVVGISGIYSYTKSLPIEVTVNGIREEIAASTTVDDIIASGLVKPKWGNFVAVDESVLELGAGKQYVVAINDTPCEDFSTRLNNFDDVVFTDGEDIMEESSYIDKSTPFKFVFTGEGAITYVLLEGQDGIKRTSTGLVSGKKFASVAQAVQDRTVQRYNPQTDEKLVALTFDNGPSESTLQILDALDLEEVKATFFTLGSAVNTHSDVAKAIVDRGHQIANHGQSFENPTKASKKGLRALITDGQSAIENATGVKTEYFRAPYGLFDKREWKIAGDLFKYQIGWNIDTNMWINQNSKSAVKNIVENLNPGRIVLLSDEDSKADKTLALTKALIKELKQDGWKFVTIEELVQLAPA